MRTTTTIIICLVMALPALQTTLYAQQEYPIFPGDTLRCLKIPERPAPARDASALIDLLNGLSIADREAAVVREVLSGNIPSFSQHLVPLIIPSWVDKMSRNSSWGYLYTTPS